MERKEKHEEERVSKNASPKTTIIINKNKNSNNNILSNPAQEEFAFGWSGSETMCAADDVFFRGKILPFQPRRPDPATAQLAAPRPQRARNRFHAHPSPKPHVSSFERARSSRRAIKPSSSLWDFFKLGLVRTPPELESSQEPSNLRSNSRAGRGVSRSSSGSNSDNTKITPTTKTKLLSGCACSVDSDSIVNSLIVTKLEEVLLPEKKRSDGDCYYYYNYSYYSKDDDYRKPKKQYSKDYEGVMRSRKQAASNHRTYEWLKELSRASLPPMHV